MANNVPVSAKTALLQRAIVARPTNAISIKLSLMTTAAGNARDAYSSTNECSATGYTFTAPSGYSSLVSKTTASGSDPSPTCKRPYAVKSGDTCKSISQANSVDVRARGGQRPGPGMPCAPWERLPAAEVRVASLDRERHVCRADRAV